MGQIDGAMGGSVVNYNSWLGWMIREGGGYMGIRCVASDWAGVHFLGREKAWSVSRSVGRLEWAE